MVKKVLIVGPDYFGYNQSVENSFVELGWETKVINYYELCPPGFSNLIKCRVLNKIGIKHYVNKYLQELNQQILEEFNRFNPTIVLVIKGNNVLPETLRKMGSAKKILWMMDSIYRYPESTLRHIREYDEGFMFEENDVIKLKDEGINAHFLPMGVDTTNYYFIDKSEKDIDLLFVGKLYDKRIELFTKMIKRFPSLNIQIYGNYTDWKKPTRYFNYFLRGYNKYFKDQYVNPEELNKLYSNSKIALNIHHAQSQNGCNPRVFEILATKTFQIVDINKYINEHFIEDSYLVGFNNEEELFNNIEYYLKHSSEREEIANRGYSYVLSEHTFLDRIKTLLETARLDN